MLDTLPMTGELEPTKTHSARWWYFVLADPAAPDFDGRLGTLTICQRKGKVGAKVTDTLYAASWDEQTGIWELVNLTDPDADEPYYLEPGGECSCDAGKFRVGHCKHRAAAQAVGERLGLRRAVPPREQVRASAPASLEPVPF